MKTTKTELTDKIGNIRGGLFFFKQWGTWGSDGVKRSKHKNGKMLDGKILQAMPM